MAKDYSRSRTGAKSDKKASSGKRTGNRREPSFDRDAYPRESKNGGEKEYRVKSEKGPAFDRESFPKKIKKNDEKAPHLKSEKEHSFNRYRDSSKPSDYNSNRQKEKVGRFEKQQGNRKFSGNKFSDNKTVKKKHTESNPFDLDESDYEYEKKERPEKPFRKTYKKFNKEKKAAKPSSVVHGEGAVRLNKYISNAGICSRREADQLIASGVIQVNGKTITEMGYRVQPTDIIKYGGQTLRKEKMVYLILNKPKDFITTVDDPQKRRTVLELVQGACKERIYPVGRLDRMTTGLLMFTNDGELTKKLTHPRYGVRKIYHVELDKPLKKQDLDKIEEGLELEDGEIKVDEITYVGDGKDKKQVGVELHSGKNRIVRRIFEHLGYNIRKLDRVMFGAITKKDLPRGHWRFLTSTEVGILNMISTGKQE